MKIPFMSLSVLYNNIRRGPKVNIIMDISILCQLITGEEF